MSIYLHMNFLRTFIFKGLILQRGTEDVEIQVHSVENPELTNVLFLRGDMVVQIDFFSLSNQDFAFRVI